MTDINFVDNSDTTTYHPFELIDCRDTEWSDVRLSFSDWDWFKATYKTDTINDYYMNGYGVQGLVLASRVAVGLEAYADGIDPNSEGDTCFMHFNSLELAIETAKLASAMINSRTVLEKTILIAREHDLED